MNASAKYFISNKNNRLEDILLYCKRMSHQQGAPESAAEVLQYYSSQYKENSTLWSHLSDYFIMSGEMAEAKSAAETSIDSTKRPHVKDIITAGKKASLALVDDEKKILYVNMPKCGSSTIKNYFTKAKFNESYGEFVHFHHLDMYRYVEHSEFKSKYADYFKFTVLRDPIKRVYSYYTKNVLTKCLHRETNGLQFSHGHPTQPGARYAIYNFHDYRRLFVDFRHHTDPLVGYIGNDLSIFDAVYDIKECDSVREHLEELYGIKLNDDRAMVTDKSHDTTHASKDENLNAFLRSFYKDDYNLFK